MLAAVRFLARLLVLIWMMSNRISLFLSFIFNRDLALRWQGLNKQSD